MRRVIAVVLLASGVGTLMSCASHARPASPRVDVTMPSPPARGVPGANHALIEDFRKAGVEAKEARDGVVIYLPAMFQFDFDEATVTTEGRRQLRVIAGLLLKEELINRHIIVEGHTDAVGTAAYNQALSTRRADAVIHELQTAGIPTTRITRRAFGATHPIAPNRKPDGSDNPEGRARNRRAQLVIENPKI